MKRPAGLLFLENLHFWNFKTSPFSKSVCFLILNNFFKNGSPGQTTMLMRRAAKFCVEPRSPFSEISHQESKTLGKPPNIVSWPECQPEFQDDADDDDSGDASTIFPSGQTPIPLCAGITYPVQESPTSTIFPEWACLKIQEYQFFKNKSPTCGAS